ncbi:MAG: C10 family peptidase [Bacteroidota bacterium]
MKKLYLFNSFIVSIIVILFTFLSSQNATAKSVDTTTACQIAENLLFERGDNQNNSIEFNSNIARIKKNADTALYYVVEVNNAFHALISADDRIYPILSYAFNPYPEGDFPPAYNEWLNNTEEQILFVLRNQLTPEAYVTEEWNYYQDITQIQKTNYKAVSPLLAATWDQGDPYNLQCPYSTSSMYNNNHVPVGCMAVAMGQIMHYHGFPSTGTGSHSYTSSYGTESANFGNTTYNWSNMPATLSSSSPSSQIDDVAELLYHCGVSVDMDYGDNGSGSYFGDAMLALGNYFNYNSSSMHHESKSSTSNWDNLIKNDIDNGRPILYRGSNSSGGGHAFVLDGYQGSNNDHYHFNWGWGDYYNNYCYLSSVVPANTTGYNYTTNQAAIFGIEPAVSPGNPDIVYHSKQIDDDNQDQSSGNDNGQAEPGETIELIVTLKNNGNGQASNVNATLSTSDPDITITDDNEDFGTISANATADCIYDYDFDVSSSCPDKDVTFTLDITDGNSNSWTETFTVHIYGNSGSSYCSGTTNITSSSGTFSDGSGTNDYNNDSDCKWLIQPSGASSINLTFSNFNTESGYDFVKVYDGSSTSDPLLGEFSGSSIPSAVNSGGGTMLVHFTSDHSNTDEGWEASFTSTSGSGPEVVYESGVIDDDNSGQSSGNNDGYADAGETIELLLELKNIGDATAYGVSTSISSSDPDITITDATENYGDISQQGTAWCPGNYVIEISSASPTKDVDILLTTTDNNGNTWTETLVLYVYGSSNNYCSGLTTFTNASGTIDDGSGASNYNNDSDCRWLIDPGSTGNISLSFSTFDTEDGYDYVKVYDGNSTSDPLLGEFCGSSLPPVVNSSGNQMLVRFTSDYSNTAAGFSASYTSGSTGISQQTKQAIKIYPNPADGHFTLSMESSAEEHLTIKITNMHGQEVYYEELKNLSATGFKKDIQTGNLSSGMYYLDVRGEKLQVKKKLIIYKR